MKKKSEEYFCRHCGAKMNRTTRPQRGNEFDTYTGKPTNLVYNYWKCPNKRIFFDSHSQYDDEPVNVDP